MQSENTKRLYAAIRQEHERLLNVKQYGVQKHSDAWIWICNKKVDKKIRVK